MTVIAFDGKTLAVDSAGTYGGTVSQIDKFRRMADGTIIVFAGAEATAHLMLDLYDAGALFQNWPLGMQTDSNTRATLVRLDPKRRRIQVAYHAPVWTPQRYVMAWGSGSEMAFGAMKAGASAVNAVKIAAKYAVGCGHKVYGFRVR